MTLYSELEARGLIFQCTAPTELAERLAKAPIALYAGFDPTADGLHIGHLLPLITLARFQRAGHRAIALAGGATGLVGDPSGKAEERALRSHEEIAENLRGIRRELAHFLDFGGSNPAIIVDNADWTKNVSLLDFLREIGKHFSINEMIRKDSVQTRLTEREQGISFTEFSYSLLQANDFLELFRKEGCTLQIGGSDQWGNITAGIDLIRKKCQQTAYGLTLPLLTNANGKKFGKTEKGAVWLSAKKTSAYHFYQFWVRSDEREVIRLLKFFTFLSLDEIAALEHANQENPARREAQKRLAAEMTRLVHGEDELQRAIRASEVLFGGSLEGIDEQSLLDIAEDAPKATLAMPAEGIALLDLLVQSALFPSRSEARRKLEAGAVYLNNIRLDASTTKIDPSARLFGKYLLLRKGKKDYLLVNAEGTTAA